MREMYLLIWGHCLQGQGQGQLRWSLEMEVLEDTIVALSPHGLLAQAGKLRGSTVLPPC